MMLFKNKMILYQCRVQVKILSATSYTDRTKKKSSGLVQISQHNTQLESEKASVLITQQYILAYAHTSVLKHCLNRPEQKSMT